MLKLSNIKVSVRIAAACLLPLLAFTAFAMNELIAKRAVFSTMNQVATVAEAAPMISGLINELQRERGTYWDPSSSPAWGLRNGTFKQQYRLSQFELAALDNCKA